MANIGWKRGFPPVEWEWQLADYTIYTDARSGAIWHRYRAND